MDDFNFDALNMDAVDEAEDSLDAIDLSELGDIEGDIDLPHLKVSTKDFLNVLRAAKLVSASGGRDIISRAIYVKAVGDQMVCYMTDFDVYLECKCELINSENILEEGLILPTDVLVKLARAVPSTTMFFKDGENYKIRLFGGDILLETIRVDSEKFIYSDPIKEEGEVHSGDLFSTIRDFSTIVTTAISPMERRILCEEDRAYAVYMWGITAANRRLTAMDIKMKDLGILKSLLAGREELLTIGGTSKSAKVARKQIKGEGFTYSFLRSESQVSEKLKSGLDEVAKATGVHVDFIQLYKIVTVASDLPYSMGKVGFRYSEDGLVVSIKTKRGVDSEFKLRGSVVDVVPSDEELILSAKLLRVFLRTFSSAPSVLISLSDMGLGVSAGDYRAAIYPENVRD